MSVRMGKKREPSQFERPVFVGSRPAGLLAFSWTTICWVYREKSIKETKIIDQRE